MKFGLILSSLILFSVLSRGEEEVGASKERVGPGKAVEAANEKEGFKLSEKAQKGMSLTFAKVTSNNLTVPAQALVSFQDFSAIYRLRDGWFRLVEVEPNFHGQSATFATKELKSGDQVVIRGGGSLRVIELDIFGPEADACAD